ncbi:MAG: hypothetical protein OSB10_09175 [Planctomycetota bacterium]|nr:hypothetical protein [Planctomycetota bacterium]
MSLSSAITAAIRGGKGLPRSIAALVTDADAQFKAVAGKIGPFDPAVTATTTTVSGNITSATASVAAVGIANVAVVIPTQPNADYLVLLTVESEGTVAADEDLLPPIIDAKTTTGFNIRTVNGAVLTRSVSFNVLIVPVV